MGRRKQPLEQLQRIAVAEIRFGPNLPRIPERVVEEMAHSLRAKGQQEPVLVVQSGKDALRLVTGRRRVLAARSLGWEHLDSIVLPQRLAPQADVIAALHRGQAAPWDLLDAFHTLKAECGWTQAHLGMAVGRTRDYVANLLCLGSIRPEVRALLQAEGHPALTVRHLRHIARTPPDEQLPVTERILGERLSTTLLEREQNGNGHRPPGQRLPVRAFRKKNEDDYPRTVQEWRRYQRQLMTDLNRLQRDEKQMRQRDLAVVAEARQRLRALRTEAATKRRRLHKELRLVQRQLS